MTKAATVEDLFAKKATTGSANLIVDADLAERWHAVEEKVASLKFADEKLLQEAESELEELRPDVEEATRVIRFRSLGRRGYRELLKQHKPSNAQRAENKKNGLGEPVWNPDTFPPALISATAIEPELTLEQAQKLWDSDEYNEAELDLLLMTTLNINARTRVMSLGKESERTSS